jgi:hypothetical protein
VNLPCFRFVHVAVVVLVVGVFVVVAVIVVGFIIELVVDVVVAPGGRRIRMFVCNSHVVGSAAGFGFGGAGGG